MTRRDTIELVGVRARGRHGVLEQEKRDGQEFVVDATLCLDTAPAARADALARTVNYAEVAAVIVEVVGTGCDDLIETLAQQLADAILASQVLVRAVEVTVHKPSAPIPHPFSDVSVRICREAPPVPAVLALGTNLGDREGHLRRGLELLAAADDVDVTWTGPVLETDPVGGVLVEGAEQGPYLNTVVGIVTSLGPWEVLALAQAIEADARRERTLRWGPRTLDVDVITWGNLVQDDPDLTLPHPRAHQRAFVLAPWAAVRPDDVLPGHGGVAALAARAPDREGIRTPGAS